MSVHQRVVRCRSWLNSRLDQLWHSRFQNQRVSSQPPFKIDEILWPIWYGFQMEKNDNQSCIPLLTCVSCKRILFWFLLTPFSWELTKATNAYKDKHFSPVRPPRIQEHIYSVLTASAGFDTLEAMWNAKELLAASMISSFTTNCVHDPGKYSQI